MTLRVGNPYEEWQKRLHINLWADVVDTMLSHLRCGRANQATEALPIYGLSDCGTENQKGGDECLTNGLTAQRF